MAAALAVVIGGVGYMVLPARSAATFDAVGGGAADPPLELLTLSHTTQPSGLTISGTIYNPRGAAPVSQVFAAVVLFGPDGNFLTSARAPLDFTTLGAGRGIAVRHHGSGRRRGRQVSSWISQPPTAR